MKITLFSQILQKVRRDSSNDLVEKNQSNHHSKGNDAWSHFVTMLFCQFAKCDSLNDICNGMLRPQGTTTIQAKANPFTSRSFHTTTSIATGPCGLNFASERAPFVYIRCWITTTVCLP